MHDDACGLGATSESAEKAAGADLTKGGDAVEAVRVELAKMTGQRDALQKTLTDEVLPQIAALAKMVGDQPVPRHLVGRAVTKGSEGDSGSSDIPSVDAIRDHLAKMSPEARADLLIKVSPPEPAAARARPLRRSDPVPAYDHLRPIATPPRRSDHPWPFSKAAVRPPPGNCVSDWKPELERLMIPL
jgi:hypothetical protein